MSLTAAASGFVVFLLCVQGTVHLYLYCKAVGTTEIQKKMFLLVIKKV